jgi:hypothetical protein
MGVFVERGREQYVVTSALEVLLSHAKCGNVGSDLHNSLMFKDNITK